MPDDAVSASRWLSDTAADLVEQHAVRLAEESAVVTAEARPQPLFLKRAVGIVRVSEVGKRKQEKNLLSPDVQRRNIDRICETENLRLVRVFEELNVSAYRRTLDKRPGLGPAVEMVQRGEADVLIVAYFDRFFRKYKVQAEVTELVEDAGGRLLAVDFGEISNKTSAQWLSASFMGLMSEYYSRLTGEKTYPAQVDAVERGIAPWAILPLGYIRGEDRKSHVDDKAKIVVIEAFERREAGASLQGIVEFLHARGYPRSFRSVQKMFHNRFYLGELHFGKLVNPRSHEAIIDGRLFRSVSAMRGDSRGPRDKSPNLLARQGLVFCATCKSKMVAGGQNLRNRPDAPRKRYYDYRCSSVISPHCERRPYILAEILDAYVVDYMKRRLTEARGRYSNHQGFINAEARANEDERIFNAAVQAFDGLGDVAATRAKLLELQAKAEASRQLRDELGATIATPLLTSLADDWDGPDMTLAHQRSALRVFISRIEISPGRGTPAERIRIVEA